jgi:hypothetical protein
LLINFFVVIKGLFLIFFLGLFVAPGGISISPIQVKVSNDPGRGITTELFPGEPDMFVTIRLSKEILLKDILDSSGTAEGAFPRDIRDVSRCIKDAEDTTFVLRSIASLDDLAMGKRRSRRRIRSRSRNIQAKGRDRRTRGFLATTPFSLVTREARFAGGGRGGNSDDIGHTWGMFTNTRGKSERRSDFLQLQLRLSKGIPSCLQFFSDMDYLQGTPPYSVIPTHTRE